MGKLIAHLDADCFYVSAERVRFKCLKNLPVGVLGNQGACVIAKSYEAKAKGVKTGDPIWDALKLAPDMIFIKRDFRWYEVLSRRMLDIVRSESPTVEYYSIDEFFFDASYLSRKGLIAGAERIQRRIMDEVGIPVTIGISLSRTLAKLISDTAKPFGCKVLTEDVPQFLEDIPVNELCGVGGRSSDKLVRNGIKTCLDYSTANRDFIRKMLTVKGEKLWFELNGTPCEPIMVKRKQHKAISRGGSLGGRTMDPDVINGWGVRNVERLIEELDYHWVLTEKITLIVSGDDGSWGGTEKTPPTASFEPLCRIVKRILSNAPRFVVSHMHIIAEKLTSRECVQQVLFPEEEDKTAGVKARINGQIGRFALRSADTLAMPELYGDSTNNYDICDIHEKTCF